MRINDNNAFDSLIVILAIVGALWLLAYVASGSSGCRRAPEWSEHAEICSGGAK